MPMVGSCKAGFSRLAVMVLAVACWSLPALAQTQRTTEWADENIIGGTKRVYTDFKKIPKWDRVRLILLDQKTFTEADLAEWVEWAESLRGKPQRERMEKINSRVNKSFPYKTDLRLWNKNDYWEDPTEAEKKGATDCEGYAIFKYFLGLAAGIDGKNMAVLIGKIRSTGEFHAILAARADERNYLLDNRKRYLIDIATERDFVAIYSITLEHIWVFPQKK